MIRCTLVGALVTQVSFLPACSIREGTTMTQATAIAVQATAQKRRPTLTLVTDIYDPDPAIIAEAMWYFKRAIEAAPSSPEAQDDVTRSMMRVLWLAQNPYNPDSRLKPARKTFYDMKVKVDQAFGEGNLPPKIYGWARNLGLIKS